MLALQYYITADVLPFVTRGPRDGISGDTISFYFILPVICIQCIPACPTGARAHGCYSNCYCTAHMAEVINIIRL